VVVLLAIVVSYLTSTQVYRGLERVGDF